MPPRQPAHLEVFRLGLIEYDDALAEQRHVVEACRDDGLPRLLLLEHPPTYTMGSRARPENILIGGSQLVEVGAIVRGTDRGGDVTFHGPGQLVGYPILDLRQWGQGPVWYVRSLEHALLQTLYQFGIAGNCREGYPGVWIGSEKIAAIGVHVSRGVTSHGFALNVNPDLRYFSHIVPCGLDGIAVTSMKEVLGLAPSMDEVAEEVTRCFAAIFGLSLDEARAPGAVA